MKVPAAPFYARLDGLGHIAASGEEAAHFLHNQLTNDVASLDGASARLAGYCTPKGRLLATFLMWRTPEAIVLQLPREIQPAVQKRLQMFVLRAKVKLADATGIAAFGLVGQAAVAAFANVPAAPWGVTQTADGVLVRLPDAAGQPVWQWIATPEQAAALLPRLGVAEAPAAAFALTQIAAGLPQVTARTQEQFVPQMINFELVGGVNFRKGCYPGQEIVARSQYLGKQKRRMLPASVAAEALPGMEVFSSADPEQPCGMVVNAAPDGEGGSALLVEVKLGALDEAGVSVHLGAPDGPALRFGTLPYPLPAEQDS